LAAFGAVAAVLPLAAAQTDAPEPMTVLVVVVDGLNPEEINPTTPALWSLREQGTWWDEARAVLIAETIPNHVAMMTGVMPARSGIPANAYWDRTSDGPRRWRTPS
jgi:predicted AlkP superfamily pyrophosphatase or phosphodiesterase